MSLNKLDFLSQVIPEHPHRRLHILLSILGVLIVIGSIIFYQTEYIKNKEEAIFVDKKVNTELTQEERAEAVAELKAAVAKTEPLTDKQRSKAIEELKKVIQSQK